MTSSSPKSARPHQKDGREYMRRFSRHRTDLPLIVRVLAEHGYVRVHGRCTEIAVSGLGAVTSAELVPGEIVALEFAIPEGEALELRAVVRHRMGFLHGFEFISLLPEQAEQIRAFCEALGDDLE
jgi:hypothetical protein